MGAVVGGGVVIVKEGEGERGVGDRMGACVVLPGLWICQ